MDRTHVGGGDVSFCRPLPKMPVRASGGLFMAVISASALAIVGGDMLCEKLPKEFSHIVCLTCWEGVEFTSPDISLCCLVLVHS
jgi:hypothetical protein